MFAESTKKPSERNRVYLERKVVIKKPRQKKHLSGKNSFPEDKGHTQGVRGKYTAKAEEIERGFQIMHCGHCGETGHLAEECKMLDKQREELIKAK